ncbi:redoxin domain-containing protein [Neolewinella lacunae]|uniref:Redoxin domain-containing protein n=1 Tax=Neolewinella lacunae TaxID=1517758 RepID=A0A923PN40_9BACT|nr:redoxin domain-containing protein [Neolewinella lacunae]MBC6994339.1 redoxin domain-containing protein [Neolewinella lacunae]MDN3635814.1 redoxin domain-containing protein [Neolewinella lacunae]
MPRFIPVLLLLFTLCSCQNQENAPEADADRAADTTAFVAQPQALAAREVPTLALGSPAPDFKLMGTDGAYHQLADYADSEILVVVFTANHCPTAQAYEQRLMDFTRDYAAKGVRVVAISPNSPLGLLYNELGYTDLNDDYDAMLIRHRDAAFNFDYLYDGDDHAASLQYGPVATPHTFVFDKARVLRYVGRIDKVERPGSANAEDLRAAVDDLLAGREVATPETKTFGCSTKWAWKTEYKEQVANEWAARPVSLESIDLAGVEELVKNSGTKLRLINLWATWCGPCVREYPEFLVLQQMYEGRDFEFISLSTDKPDQHEKALKFLEKVHSPVRNLHYSGQDVYELIEAIDPEWNGAIPYTLLVAPGGEVVYRHQAEVDFLELKRAIVDHPMLGRYF